jgi:hypothetical protein
MFRAYPAHLQEVYVVTVYIQSLVLSLCKSEFLLLQSDDTRDRIYTVTKWTF